MQEQPPVSSIQTIITNTIKNVLHFLHGYFAFLRIFEGREWGDGAFKDNLVQDFLKAQIH